VILPDVEDMADNFWGFDGPTVSPLKPDIQTLEGTSLHSIISTSQPNGSQSFAAENKIEDQKIRERKPLPSDERQTLTHALRSKLNGLRL
jgi:hypothetical protein